MQTEEGYLTSRLQYETLELGEKIMVNLEFILFNSKKSELAQLMLPYKPKPNPLRIITNPNYEEGNRGGGRVSI